MHKLRSNLKLKPSLWNDITDQLLDELLDTKDWIEKQQTNWYSVALVHLSWDLMHSAHIQYMNVIKEKLKIKFWKKVKLLVWVEADSRTKQRKNKDNINSEQERKYMFENLKSVDKSYIEFEWVVGENNEQRPAWIVKFLSPDVMVSHQEHINNFEEYLWVSRRMQKNNWWKVLVVNYWDESLLWEDSIRKKFGVSTTKKIIKIFRQYKGNPKYDK